MTVFPEKEYEQLTYTGHGLESQQSSLKCISQKKQSPQGPELGGGKQVSEMRQASEVPR